MTNISIQTKLNDRENTVRPYLVESDQSDDLEVPMLVYGAIRRSLSQTIDMMSFGWAC